MDFPMTGSLQSQEIAHFKWRKAKLIQVAEFSEDIQQLNKNKRVKPTSKLSPWNVFPDSDNILHVRAPLIKLPEKKYSHYYSKFKFIFGIWPPPPTQEAVLDTMAKRKYLPVYLSSLLAPNEKGHPSQLFTYVFTQ